MTAPSTEKSTAASSESFVPFDHFNRTRVARQLRPCHGCNLWRVPLRRTSAESKHVLLLARRTSSMRSSERLAGIQNNRSFVAQNIGRPGRSARRRKPRGTRVSTSNFRAVPGRTATTDKTLKAAAVGGSRVNTRSSSSFSPTIYTDTRQNSSRKNKEGCNTLTWDAATTGCTEEVQSVDAGYGRLLKLVGGGEGSRGVV